MMMGTAEQCRVLVRGSAEVTNVVSVHKAWWLALTSARRFSFRPAFVDSPAHTCTVALAPVDYERAVA